jgi:hypothetical protein
MRGDTMMTAAEQRIPERMAAWQDEIDRLHQEFDNGRKHASIEIEAVLSEVCAEVEDELTAEVAALDARIAAAMFDREVALLRLDGLPYRLRSKAEAEAEVRAQERHPEDIPH